MPTNQGRKIKVGRIMLIPDTSIPAAVCPRLGQL